MSLRRDINAALTTALRDDLARHGRTAVEDLRNTDPARYLRLCARMLPRDETAWVLQDIGEEEDERKRAAARARPGAAMAAKPAAPADRLLPEPSVDGTSSPGCARAPQAPEPAEGRP